MSTPASYDTADTLARLYHVSIGTIYRWASQDQWRRTNPNRRPVRYNHDDVTDSYRRRHEPPEAT